MTVRMCTLLRDEVGREKRGRRFRHQQHDTNLTGKVKKMAVQAGQIYFKLNNKSYFPMMWN